MRKFKYLVLLITPFFVMAGAVRAQDAKATAATESVAEAEPELQVDTTESAESVAAPRIELTPQILYQFLLAEVAAQRGQYDLAARAHADLANSTRDARIARRAAETAMMAKQMELALAQARLWLEIEPTSTLARQTVASLLAVGNRLDELADLLAKDLVDNPARVGESLLRLTNVMSRHTDKKAVQKLIEQLAAPYESLPEAHMARAKAAVAVNETISALAHVDKALELRPQWELAALMKAQLLERSPEQTAFLQRFVAANPKAFDARQAYARALVGDKKFAEARAEFRTLNAAQPENIEPIYALGILALQLEDLVDAERHLRHVLEFGKGDPNPVRYYLAQISEETNHPDEAIRLYNAIDAGEHRLPAVLRCAQLLAKAGRSDEARERLSYARSIAPKEEPRLLIAEAQLLREAGRHEEVLHLLADGLVKNPDQPELLYESAVTAERLDKLDLAEQSFRKLIALQPDQAIGYNALGYSLADRNVRLDEAQTLIDKALSLAPGDPFILDSKGWLLFRQAKLEQALTPLRQAYAARPDAEIAAHLGEVLWTLGRTDEARALWQAAIKNHPTNSLLSATIKRFTP
ncbi:MAG: tetratricopeptide repeat protein [Rhodocyclaceae bacterium]|nr:tetratricopeptide repeat protein [Rhodocyclaceae bacterium]MBP6278514.1 tetratricopeptide repeat protein [Rhodocyclaceae bacterium]